MSNQTTLFESRPTRRRLLEDEVYCPVCRVVSEAVDNVPDCLFCDGPVLTAGAVIDFGDIRREERKMNERRNIEHVVTELECEGCKLYVWGDTVPSSARCPKCGSDDVETRGYVVDSQGWAVV